MTEWDVLEAYRDVIHDAALRYGKGIPLNDSMQIAREAFLCAIRIYRSGYTKFVRYADRVMYHRLRWCRIKNNRIRREESLCLDRPVGEEEDAPTIGALYTAVPDFAERVWFVDFMERLDEDVQKTAWMIVDRYTKEEILKIRKLSLIEWSWQINLIKEAWQNYHDHKELCHLAAVKSRS